MFDEVNDRSILRQGASLPRGKPQDEPTAATIA
jgi:hypothetical protein